MPKPLLFALILFFLSVGNSLAERCSLSATGVDFGGYDVFSALPKDAIGTLTVTCNIPAQNPHAPFPVTITLSPGNSGAFHDRQMQSTSSDRLSYNLFTGPSFSTIWGDGSGGSTAQTNFVSSEFPWAVTIYGRIPAKQNVPVGSYGDVITVTILF